MSTIAVDNYSIRARVVPVLLVMMPVVLAVPCVGLAHHPVLGLGSALVIAALVGILGQVGRDAGKSKEPDLFRSWGGNPAAIMLRHRDSRLNPVTKERYHAKLGGLRRSLRMPTLQSEIAAPEVADGHYASCVDFLREATRDRGRFGLVFGENVNYGLRRNLWAMKPTGIALAIGGAGFCALVESDATLASRGVPLIVDAAMLSFWLARVTPNWVRSAAESYAERLLGACDSL